MVRDPIHFYVELHILTPSMFVGILPRDGKNIKFSELGPKIQTTYNFASTFCFYVPNFAAGYLNRSYKNDTFDLHELDLHSDKGIEHDASLTRTIHLFLSN